MYRKDWKGYPAPGFVPSKKYGNVDRPDVCFVCRDLIHNTEFEKLYWKTAQAEWKEAERRRIENKKKLSGEKDYFTGQ